MCRKSPGCLSQNSALPCTTGPDSEVPAGWKRQNRIGKFSSTCGLLKTVETELPVERTHGVLSSFNVLKSLRMIASILWARLADRSLEDDVEVGRLLKY